MPATRCLIYIRGGIAWTYNSTDGGQLYVDGLPVGNKTGSGVLATNTSNTYIGQSGTFNGKLDDVRIYDRVLYDDEIYDLADYETFNYDKLGNRTDVVNRNGLADKYAVDPLTNRYDNASVTDATVSHVYDDCGNLTDDGDYLYSWDYENRLLTVTRKIDSVVVVQYDYDALGRRIRKYDCIANAKTLYWYNNNWQVLTETDGDNVELRRNIFGNYIDELIGYNDVSGSGDDIHTVLHDHLYSPVALVDSSGVIVERYEYNAYGKPTIYDGDYQEISATAHDNQVYFTGRRVDVLDGGDKLLQYSRNRYLDYDTGRWLSHDPLGIVPDSYRNVFMVQDQYTNGLNIYAYVGNSPVVNFDPDGRVWGWVIAGCCAVGGVIVDACINDEESEAVSNGTPWCDIEDCNPSDNAVIQNALSDVSRNLNEINDEVLRECIANKISHGTIQCSEAGANGAIGMGNDSDSDVVLFTNNIDSNGTFQGGINTYTMAHILMHEFAHSCGWRHESGEISTSGVPIPFGDPMNDDVPISW
ncbi:MAG: hypothetical protein JEZ07_12410 [Phycisphaerae bacterium]|nr:hypothetical protein [Phycisphaerae bacterium]